MAQAGVVPEVRRVKKAYVAMALLALLFAVALAGAHVLGQKLDAQAHQQVQHSLQVACHQNTEFC
jgi:hypothetical protein